MSEVRKHEDPGSDAGGQRRRWKVQRIGAYGLSAFVLLFLLAFVHPFGNAKLSDSDKQLMTSAHIESPVLNVIQRSCQNCHSERTTWPVYSHIAPISWLIEKDVQEGRSRWNMSKWEQYSSEDREHILSQIGPMVRNKKMPLPQYGFLHPEARLSDGDAELLYQWSRQERKRLKSEADSAVPAQR
ncbi:MAG TPA: heme-binding domain-containing protein [Terriglobales bacterium]|nr:heme-binding domain-containing protein [Terriglobales bacterium]